MLYSTEMKLMVALNIEDQCRNLRYGLENGQD